MTTYSLAAVTAPVIDSPPREGGRMIRREERERREARRRRKERSKTGEV